MLEVVVIMLYIIELMNFKMFLPQEKKKLLRSNFKKKISSIFLLSFVENSGGKYLFEA